jgi:AMMECR1 domain-containing protein
MKRDVVILNGCIDLTETRFILREAVPINTISCAVTDSRFPQVTLVEFPQESSQEPDTELFSFESESVVEN